MVLGRFHPACLKDFCQLPQDLVMTPPVPTLGQSFFATRQDVLQAWVWGMAELAVFLGAIPPTEVAETGEDVVGGPNEEA